MIETQKLKILYWILSILSIILIVVPVIMLLKLKVSEDTKSKPFYLALSIFAGVCFHATAMAIDHFFMKEGYADEKLQDQRRDFEYDGIGNIGETKNNPLENKIPNLHFQSATDLVDYTRIRGSLTKSLTPPPFAMGAQEETKLKSNPNGF